MPRHLARSCALALLVASAGAVEQYVNPEGSPEDLTARGNTALHNRQFDTAISYYEQALEADHTYFHALFNLGLTHQERARFTRDADNRVPHYHDARRYYTRALRQRPDSAEVHCNLGIIAYQLGEYQLAAQRFQAAHEKATNSDYSAEYAFNRGTALEQLQRWTDAKAAYEICLSQNPDHFGARYNLGTLLMRHLDDPITARRELKLAHEIDPKRPEPLLNLGVLAEARQVSEAERLFTEAVGRANDYYPGMLDRVRWRRAQFYWHNDIPGKAAKVLAKLDLEAILDHDPDFPGANGLMGQYYESVAQYEKAVRHFEREVAEGNFDSTSEIDLQSHYYLAIIYSDHYQDPSKALLHATRYYELRPDETGNALRRRAQRILDADTLGTP